jgi:hypothetical protein
MPERGAAGLVARLPLCGSTPEDRVVAGGGPWAMLNEGYASCANQMGFLIDLCRIRQPGDKGKVEKGGGRDVKELMVG